MIPSRKVYRLSIVPGGIYSSQELEEARVADTVVAAHYSDFGRVTRSNLPADTLLYVSYRVGDRVYWTAKPHRIPKGEAILTDGSHMARVRCGNRLSVKRQDPIQKEKDPTEAMLGELQPPEADFLNAEGKPSLKPPEMDFAVGRSGAGPDPSSFPFLSPNLSIASPAIANPAATGGGGLPSVFAIPLPVSSTTGSSSTNGGGGTNDPGDSGASTVAPEPGAETVLLGLLLISLRLISRRRDSRVKR